MKHVILRQTIEILTENATDAFILQQRLSDLYHADILPTLSDVFDTCSDDEATLCVDQMIIDLGSITEQDLDHPENIVSLLIKVSKQVSEQLRHGVWRKTPGAIVSTNMHAFDHWLFYMEHGYLKWNVVSMDDTWYRKVLEAASGQQVSIEALRALIKQSSRALQRIVLQHTSEFLAHLIEALTAQSQTMLPILIDKLCVISSLLIREDDRSGGNDERLQPLAIWRRILFMITVTPASQWTTEQVILAYLKGEFKPVEVAGMIAILSDPQHEQVRKDVAEVYRLLLTVQKSSDVSEIQKGDAEVMAPNFGVQEDNHPLTAGFLSDESTIPGNQLAIPNQMTGIVKDRTEAEVKHLAEDGLFVRHAGLVLLHPFLHAFFKEVKLSKDGRFVNDFAVQRAMLFLQFLAMGDDHFQEYEMVVAKLLCGVPFEDPFDSSQKLSEIEKNTAEELLDDVIRQWEILKNTSSSGLREAFLQRAGKYYVRNDRHYLHVENSSIDMLLDRLPWALGPVKLPWMTHMLNVEWR